MVRSGGMAKTMQVSAGAKPAPARTNASAKAKVVVPVSTVTKAKAPALSASAKKKAPTPKSLKKGDWLDVMDKEGTWNVAQILSMPTATLVEVKYDAWGPEYNEIVAIDSGRVAPFHTYTWTVKCWAKYKNWPWWPSVVEFRSPGTPEGQEYLAKETHMFVDFLDNRDISKRCRRWIEVSQIKPYHPKANLLRKESNSPGFEASYTRLLLSHARQNFDPLLNGHALPVEFTTRPAYPVSELKRLLGLDAWSKLMYSSRVRHGEVYAYQPPSVKEDLGFDDEDIDDDAFDDLDDVGGRQK